MLIYFYLSLLVTATCSVNKIYSKVLAHICKDIGGCCDSNLDCKYSCCDPYTKKCQPKEQADFYYTNYPYSTNCIALNA